MTKRLISLMLAVLMLAFTLVSCGKDGDAIDNAVNDASRYTSTLTLWVITESKLVQKASELLHAGYDPDKYPEEPGRQTEEQAAFIATLEPGLEKTWRQVDDICDQINVLTKKRFKTQVIIRYFTEDEYYAKLEGAFTDLSAAQAEAEQSGKPLFAEVTSDETVKDEHGVPELKYPTALDAQADIVFVGGSQNYFKYVSNNWLAEIESKDIEDSANQLTYHLTSALLSAPKCNGKIYAIPNNNPLGEYTYVAIDTALMQEYYTSTDAIGNSMYSAEMKQFLAYVYNRDGGEQIYPIYSATGKVDFEMLHYWSFDTNYVQTPGVFSLFGGFYSSATTPFDTLTYRNILTQDSYLNALETKVYYENTAGYITQDANARSAVRVVKGTAADKAELERMGYTVLTTSTPRISDDDVFGSMFAVGKVNRDKSRSLEIIAMLNTEPEIRNLLQYGIEGVNYTLKNVEGVDGEVRVYADMKSDNMYVMDVAKTGNMFVAYPNAAESDIANGKYGVYEWDNAKKQNLDATLYPTLGLSFNTAYKVDDKAVRIMSAVSAKFKAVVLDTLTTTAQVNELRAELAALASGNEAMAAWLLSKTGEVLYTPSGATAAVAVTVADLTAALAGLASSYSGVEGPEDVLSTKVLYEEWWTRNYGAANK